MLNGDRNTQNSKTIKKIIIKERNCRLLVYNALSDGKEDENRLRIDGATDIAKNKWKRLNWISDWQWNF